MSSIQEEKGHMRRERREGWKIKEEIANNKKDRT